MDNRNRYNRIDRPSTRRRRPVSKTEAVINWFKPVSGAPDYMFLAVVVLLLTYGIIMLFSAGASRAYANFGDSFWYMKNQLGGVALGAVAMYVCSKFDYHRYGGKIAGMLYIFCGILLVLVIAGLGTTVNGATRWLFGFQPSEIAKIAIIILFSYNLSRPSGQRDLKSFKQGFLPYIIMLGVYVGLLILQPHFSCIVLIGATAMILLFVAGAPMKHFVMIGMVAVVLLIAMIIKEPYRMARITSFLDPFADKQGSGWQIVQSLYAIGSGGIFGVGLGKSRQKFQSLPEPHNDFIFSVLCEELGLVGAILLITLFILLLYRGIKIAAKAPDLFGTLLVVGIVGIVVLQALVNIAVVTASIPVTGMPLPFFSYGSTALTITMAEMGIVLNVSRQSKLPI